MNITESDIRQFLQAAARDLQAVTNRPLVEITISASAYGAECGEPYQKIATSVYADGAGRVESMTIAGGCVEIAAKCSPVERAKLLRSQADVLMETAARLTAQAAKSEAVTEARNRSADVPVNHHD